MAGQKLGDMTIQSITGEHIFYQAPVNDSVDTQSDGSFLGLNLGEFDSLADAQHPEWLWNPEQMMEPVNVPGGPQQVLTIQYQDLLKKSVAIANGYKVKVYIEYLERNDEVEAIQDPQERKRRYDRALCDPFHRITCE